jgi:hypothetical protein
VGMGCARFSPARKVMTPKSFGNVAERRLLRD